MSDIFQEVDEEVRRDKALEFWKKHQNLIIAGAALIVLATGGYRFYENRKIAAQEAAGAAFQQALTLDREGKTADAQTALAALAANAPHGYQSLARLAGAAVQSKTDPKGALAVYDALATDRSIGPLFQDAAKLRGALLRLDQGDVAAAKPVFEALAAPTGPYRFTALLALGVIAIDANNYTEAGQQLDRIVADPEAPAAEKRSAESLFGLVAANRTAK
jgi:hypothetical protein